MKFRFIRTEALDAAQNMAIDKALALTYKKDHLPIFRLYTWQPSFTIGVSQTLDDYNTKFEEFKNNSAKRMTGGGVLFHGHDVSYSLVLPSEEFKNLSVKESYEQICSFLLTFYASLGLDAHYAKDLENIRLSKSEFCQVGFEAYDIIINGVKIGGNAQKRTKNMIFQHGSIPLFTSKVDQKVGHSLEDINVNIDFEACIDRLKEAFETTFECELIDDTLNDEEQQYLNDILKD